MPDGRLGFVRGKAEGGPRRPQVALISDSAGGRLPSGPALWQPIRRGDILQVLEPGSMHLPRRQLDEALSAAANLAA